MEVFIKVSMMNKVVVNEEIPMDFAPVSYITDCMVEVLQEYGSGKRKPLVLKEGEEPDFIEIYAHKGLKMSQVREAIQSFFGKDHVRDVSMAEFSKIFRETMEAMGTSAAKTLRMAVTPDWGAQVSTFMFATEKVYTSPKHGPPPPMDKTYLMQLLKIIHEDMLLDGGKSA